MCCYGVQVFLSLFLCSAGGHFLLGGYPNQRYGFDQGPPPPHPIVIPPPQIHPILRFPPHIILNQAPPLIYRDPSQTIIIPVHLRGVFPPFIERIVQRIQTYWSVYNPPEVLTRPPDVTYNQKPNKKVSTTTQTPQEEGTTTEAGVTVVGGPGVVETTTLSTPQDSTTKEISTLAVFEVTPSNDPDTTTAGAEPPDLETETQEPVLITPENANLEGRKEAFLRFLQTAKVPPVSQMDSLNEMEDVLR